LRLRCVVRRPRSLRVTARCHEWQCAREHVAKGFANPGRSWGAAQILIALALAEAAAVTMKVPYWRLATEVVSARQGVLRLSTFTAPPKRVGSCATRSKVASRSRSNRSCVANARHTAGSPTTPPLGFGSFRRLNTGDRHVGLPHQRRPFSGFLTLSTV